MKTMPEVRSSCRGHQIFGYPDHHNFLTIAGRCTDHLPAGQSDRGNASGVSARNMWCWPRAIERRFANNDRPESYASAISRT